MRETGRRRIDGAFWRGATGGRRRDARREINQSSGILRGGTGKVDRRRMTRLSSGSDGPRGGGCGGNAGGQHLIELRLTMGPRRADDDRVKLGVRGSVGSGGREGLTRRHGSRTTGCSAFGRRSHSRCRGRPGAVMMLLSRVLLLLLLVGLSDCGL